MSEVEVVEELPIDVAHPIDGVFTFIARAAPAPPTWVVDNLLPIGLTLLGGPPKGGKSTIILSAALTVSGHDCFALPPFLKVAPEEGPVLVFSAEASAGELRHMAETHLNGVSFEEERPLLIADDPWEFRLDEPGGTDRFLHWCDVWKPKLVVLDPLRNFHSQDENDSSAMYNLLRPLRQWAIDNLASLVVVHHTVKKRSEDGGPVTYGNDDLRGTSALFGMADGLVMITPAPSDLVNIKATFKRGEKWDRTLLVASYRNKNKRAGEQLDLIDQQVLSQINTHNLKSMSAVRQHVSGISSERLELTGDKLKRNGWIKELFR